MFFHYTSFFDFVKIIYKYEKVFIILKHKLTELKIYYTLSYEGDIMFYDLFVKRTQKSSSVQKKMMKRCPEVQAV